MLILSGHCYAGSGLLAFAHDLRTMRNDKGWLCFNEVFINRRFSEANYKMLRYSVHILKYNIEYSLKGCYKMCIR